MLAEAGQKGVDIAKLTLHVGIGTFRSVLAKTIEGHKMHSEEFDLSPQSAEILNRAKSKGNWSSQDFVETL